MSIKVEITFGKFTLIDFISLLLKQAFGDPKATPAKVLDQVRDWYKTVAKEDFIEISSISGKQKTAQEARRSVCLFSN